MFPNTTTPTINFLPPCIAAHPHHQDGRVEGVPSFCQPYQSIIDSLTSELLEFRTS